ncbi:MAG: hypothetical protein P8Y98_06185 [Anaerolineales bacterium]
MNVLKSLFGIFRQRGLVSTIKEGRSLKGFILAAFLFSLFGGAVYGFAMGIGIGTDTALKDAFKVALIVAFGLLLSVPIFWVTFRLLGREEKPSQVTAIPLTLIVTVAMIMLVTAPIVLMLSVLVGYDPNAVYIHIVILDMAALVGLYLVGTLLANSFAEPRQLIMPNVIGFLLMTVILVVLISFLAPCLSPRATFSVGTDRFMDGLGIGVAEKADHALLAAKSASRVNYQYQTTNDNGDLVRDYTVTRVGDDYHLEVHLHAVPGEPIRSESNIWVIDGNYYTDYDNGRVNKVSREDLTSVLDSALPEAAFSLPAELQAASWRAYERQGRYTATGTGQALDRVVIEMDADSGRLVSLTLGRAERSLHAEVRVRDFQAAAVDRATLLASLNQAIVLGSVDRTNAAMIDYVQDETFFVVRYPREWSAGVWNQDLRRVGLSAVCREDQSCPELTVSVYDLAEGKGARQYAEDLSDDLSLQPEYRAIAYTTRRINGRDVGVVEFLYDRTVKGELETESHIEFIFVGQDFQYHLDFAAPETDYNRYRDLFAEMAGLFTYLVGEG